MSDKNLKERILNEIQNQKPKPKWYFEVAEILKVFLVVAAILISGILLGFFIWDTIQIWNFRESVSPIMKFGTLFLELPVIVLIIGIFGYFIYRSSDLPGVKNRSLIFGGIAAFVVIIGTVVLILPNLSSNISDAYNSRQEDLDNLPFHSGRVERIFEGNENHFAGVLTSVERSSNDLPIVTLTNPKEEKSFKLLKKPPMELRLNDPYEVGFKPEKPNEAEEIKPLPKGPKMRTNQNVNPLPQALNNEQNPSAVPGVSQIQY